jgi:hypothetical protein
MCRGPFELCGRYGGRGDESREIQSYTLLFALDTCKRRQRAAGVAVACPERFVVAGSAPEQNTRTERETSRGQVRRHFVRWNTTGHGKRLSSRADQVHTRGELTQF